jgi:hypothetical protein
MSDQRPLPAFLKKNGPYRVRRRSEPNFFVQMFLAFVLAVAILAIGAASAFYWLFMVGVA